MPSTPSDDTPAVTYGDLRRRGRAGAEALIAHGGAESAASRARAGFLAKYPTEEARREHARKMGQASGAARRRRAQEQPDTDEHTS